jgi:hypothetical protein
MAVVIPTRQRPYSQTLLRQHIASLFPGDVWIYTVTAAHSIRDLNVRCPSVCLFPFVFRHAQHTVLYVLPVLHHAVLLGVKAVRVLLAV